MASFAELFSPDSPEKFFSEIWQKRTHRFPTSAARKQLLDAFQSLDGILELLRRAERFDPGLRVGWLRTFTRGGFDENHLERPLTASLALLLLETGTQAVLTLEGLHVFDSTLNALVRSFRHGLAMPALVESRLFLHPGGGGYVPLHFDRGAALQLVLSGKKRWKVSSQPLCEWPISARYEHPNRTLNVSQDLWGEELVETSSLEFEEWEMAAGDLLYLPAGTPHTTESSNASIALTVGIEPVRVRDIIEDALGRLMKPELLNRVLPRQSAQVPTHAEVVGAAMREKLDLSSKGFEAAINASIYAYWARSAASPFRHRVSPGGAPLSRKAQCRLTPFADLFYLPFDDNCLLFFCEDEIELERHWEPVLDALMTGAVFVVADLLALVPAHPWEEFRELLISLRHIGALVVRDRREPNEVLFPTEALAGEKEGSE